MLPGRNRHKSVRGQPRLGDPLYLHNDEVKGRLSLDQGAESQLDSVSRLYAALCMYSAITTRTSTDRVQHKK